MTGLDHRGRAVEKVPDDPEPLSYAEALERDLKQKGVLKSGGEKLKTDESSKLRNQPGSVSSPVDISEDREAVWESPGKRKNDSNNTADNPPQKKAKASMTELHLKPDVASSTRPDGYQETPYLDKAIDDGNDDSALRTSHSPIDLDEDSDDEVQSTSTNKSDSKGSTTAMTPDPVPGAPAIQVDKEDEPSITRSFGSGSQDLVPHPTEPRGYLPKIEPSTPIFDMNTTFRPQQAAEYVPDHSRRDTYDPARPNTFERNRQAAEYQPDHSDNGEEYDPQENSVPQNSPQRGVEGDLTIGLSDLGPISPNVDCIGCWYQQTSTGQKSAECFDCRVEYYRAPFYPISFDWVPSPTADEAFERPRISSPSGFSDTTTQNPRIMDLEGPDAGCWDARYTSEEDLCATSELDHEEDYTDWEDEEPDY